MTRRAQGGPTARPATMEDRTVLITGASRGIGRATAVGLGRLGAHVAITGRDEERTQDAADEVRASGCGDVEMFIADLSSQAAVRRLAGEVLERLPILDVLVNNVGGFWNTRHTTVDGLERTFAVNHLAAFLLTDLLLDRLKDAPAARIITVASNAHALGRIHVDDLQSEHDYSGARAYNQSKLANLLFTYELARRVEGSSVSVNAVHPGMVRTQFGADDPGRLQRVLVPFMRPFMQSPTAGATTSIRVASAPELATTTGRYFAKGRSRHSSRRSYDEADAVRLWQVSAALVGSISASR